MYKLKALLTLLLVLFVPSSLLGTDTSPFDDFEYFAPLGKNRATDFNKLRNRVIGQYGDYRKSKTRGHKHSGIDIEGFFGETIFSIGKGMVTHIFREFPHKTIYIRHINRVDAPFYAVYIHVEDIRVDIGDLVTENTPIGRIFNSEELRSANFGTPPHLHFEIRHNIEDKGKATFNSMRMSELNRYCIDPLKFFKSRLK